MPNATCILIAYALVLVLEGIRWWVPAGDSARDKWLKFGVLCVSLVALLTHTLYLLDRVFVTLGPGKNFALVSWHDWTIFTSWAIALVYGFLLLRRGDSRFGAFILPTVILLVGGSLALPPVTAADSSYSVSGWRFAHSVAMMAGTVLVSIGFAMGVMYLLQASRLKSKRRLATRIPLPSLEYLQTSGRICLLGSAASIGFGMLAGVIMNLTKDGRVEWMDRGILFSGGLFVWLAIASFAQSVLTKRGIGRATASMNILSFVIVVAAIGLVLTTPHGANRNEPPTPPQPSLDQSVTELSRPMNWVVAENNREDAFLLSVVTERILASSMAVGFQTVLESGEAK